MKLPKHLYVFGEKYTLKQIEGLSAHGIAGQCHKVNKTIIVDSKLKGAELQETILHELFHAVVSEVSIDQTLSHELEEVIVDTFAKAVCKNFNIRSKPQKK